MPIYKYEAVLQQGKKIKGKYEGKSEEEVLQVIRQQRAIPITIKEVIEKNSITEIELFNPVSIKDLAIFCRQFYTMLNAGVAIITCLDILRQQTNNKKLKRILGEVYENVQKGMTFSEALKKHTEVFPELLINMTEAGEASGNLDTIMDRMASHYEKEHKINNKIKGAMVYPIILSVVSVMVVIFLLTFVMPTFMSMFTGSGVELPMPTRVLLAISDGLQRYWYIFLLGLVSIIAGGQYYLKTSAGKWTVSKIKLNIPIVKDTTIKVITSRFARTLATLISSGVPLIQSLEIVAKIVGNKVVEKGINEAKEEISKGYNLSKPIQEMGIFPPMLYSMIQVGEESGVLDTILEKTANFYDEEVEIAIQKMTTLIEPIMIVVMALLIGFIVISMVLPMFDMMNTV
ncbi:MAG: type II secretion system F family protein [Clostridiaceae bacterium]|nr:type II secretion system F family protein [Clostridiaceae bacterium]